MPETVAGERYGNVLGRTLRDLAAGGLPSTPECVALLADPESFHLGAVAAVAAEQLEAPVSTESGG